MNTKWRKAAAAGLCVCLGLSVFAGCGKKDGFDTDKTVLTVDGDEVSAGVMKFAAYYEQSQADAMQADFGYAGGLQADSSESLEDQMTEEMTRLLLAEQHMEDYGVSLTEDQKTKLSEAVATFRTGKEDDFLDEICADQKTMERCFELFAEQAVMRAAMENDADAEVSDEEAAQRKITYALFSGELPAAPADDAAVPDEQEPDTSAEETAAPEEEETASLTENDTTNTQSADETEEESGASEDAAEAGDAEEAATEGEDAGEAATEAEAAEEAATEAEGAEEAATEAEGAEEAATEAEDAGEAATEAEGAEEAATEAEDAGEAAAEAEEAGEDAAEAESAAEGEDAEEAAPVMTAEEIAARLAAAKAEYLIARVYAGEDFETAARAIDPAVEIGTVTFGEGDAETQAELIEATNGLADGALVNAPIETESGCCVVRLDSQVDPEATDAEKGVILEQRKAEKVDELFEQWKGAVEVSVDSEVLAGIGF